MPRFHKVPFLKTCLNPFRTKPNMMQLRPNPKGFSLWLRKFKRVLIGDQNNSKAVIVIG